MKWQFGQFSNKKQLAKLAAEIFFESTETITPRK
jgi:hypothetical protein